MKKKFLALALALVLCLSLLPVSALAADGDFVIEDGTLVRYKGSGGDVVIPDGVKVIKGSAFYSSRETLTSVTIPGSVQTIEDYFSYGSYYGAFTNCVNLKSVKFSNGLKEIKGYIFSGCKSLTSIEIPDSVQTIGKEAFKNCEALTSVKLPKGLKEIADGTFFNCKSLTSIEIPESVETIGEGAFGSSGLTSVSIPDGIQAIGDYAFEHCKALADVKLPKNLKAIGFGSFRGCENLTSIDIPYGVETIDTAAFSGTGLTSVVIPDSVYSLNGIADLGVFNNCPNLTSVKLPKDYTAIPAGFVSNCKSLKSFDIPNSVNIVGFFAFYGSGLENISIPYSVREIYNCAFADCDGLTSVTIPQGVQIINYGAFLNCDNLKDIIVPPSVKEFGEHAIGYKSNESNNGYIAYDYGHVTIHGQAGSAAETYARENNIKFSADWQAPEFIIENGVLIKYNGKGGAVTIPDSVTKIGDHAFAYCGEMTSVAIPDSVQAIGNYAFTETGLTNVSIPDSVQTIGKGAFKGPDVDVCPLKSVKLPKGLKKIEDYTFWGCDQLTSINLPESLESIGEMAFNNTAMPSVTFPKSLKTIGPDAFDHNKFTSITIPGSATIEPAAFWTCQQLEKATIENGVPSIGFRAFANCDKMTDIIVPPSVKEIGDAAIGYKVDQYSYEETPYEYGHVTIHGQAGSEAERYANANNIKFVADWTGDTPSPTEPDPVEKFEDVNAGAWYVSAVKFVLETKLFEGTSDNTFEPGTSMSRAMFVVVLARREGVDTNSDVWYEKGVNWAMENGLLDSGLANEVVQSSIPRQEMALILYRHAGSPAVSGNLDGFTDADAVSAEARDAVIWAVNNGYIQGIETADGISLSPSGSSSRAEVATIFMRVFG